MSKTSKKTTRKKAAPGLEEALKQLEELVEKMEEGELTLEQSLAEFQRGVELTRLCRNALKDAEQKVKVLQKKAGGTDLGDLADFTDDD
ncbi:MAG: exodeoxyribonuclease VII small subunit [Gammaproteobacteria bacterium]|nr:exodeoxyribonuclease VII small subunit [Gammaproteobacteria bacterium]